MSKVSGEQAKSVAISVRISEADKRVLLRNAARAEQENLSDYLRLLIVSDVRVVSDERLLQAFGHLLRLSSTAIEQEADPNVRANLQEICRHAGAALLGRGGS